MKLTKSFASFGFALSLMMAGTAQAQDPGLSDTAILIGDILPVSGPAALLGFAHTLGVKAAAEEVNAAGGINGRMVKVVTEDDATSIRGPSRACGACSRFIMSLR